MNNSPSSHSIKELLDVLKLTEKDLLDLSPNINGKTGYYCDFCLDDCFGYYFKMAVTSNTTCCKCFFTMDVDELIKLNKIEKISREAYTYINETIINKNTTLNSKICELCKKNKTTSMTKYIDVCIKCQNKETIPLEYCTRCDAIEYLDELSYEYKFIFIKKISDNEFIYIVEEKNFDMENQDIHYYLKYFLNDKIILDHELQTHNPYAGIYDIDV